MEKLQNIIRPTIGILTNIGSAHDEGFASIGEKIKEKLRLFSNCNTLIYNKNKTIDAFLNSTLNTFSWSFNDKEADVFIQKISGIENTQFQVQYKANSFDFTIPFQDNASIENAIHCMMVLSLIHI